MAYEQALALVGGEPTWVLQSFYERYPRGSKLWTASKVVLQLRNSTATLREVNLTNSHVE